MKKFTILILALLVLCSCVDKHPYKYIINENITKPNKEISNWKIEQIENGTNLPMAPEKKTELTNQIYSYLKTKGLNVSKLSPDEENSNVNYFLIRPKIIQTMAKISQNIAGWHGATEDPLNFWSHFSAGGFQTVNGSVAALSLYIEIYFAGQKYYENAGGIELVGKYNKYSFQTTIKDEIVSDNEKFINAMNIAFKPLLEAVK